MAQGAGDLSIVDAVTIPGLEWLTEPRKAALLYIRARSGWISGERVLGELRDRFGVSKTTLRYLHEKGLIEPKEPDLKGSDTVTDENDKVIPLLEVVDQKWRITGDGRDIASDLISRAGR